jgi:hypothetical protein
MAQIDLLLFKNVTVMKKISRQVNGGGSIEEILVWWE